MVTGCVLSCGLFPRLLPLQLQPLMHTAVSDCLSVHYSRYCQVIKHFRLRTNSKAPFHTCCISEAVRPCSLCKKLPILTLYVKHKSIVTQRLAVLASSDRLCSSLFLICLKKMIMNKSYPSVLHLIPCKPLLSEPKISPVSIFENQPGQAALSIHYRTTESHTEE